MTKILKNWKHTSGARVLTKEMQDSWLQFTNFGFFDQKFQAKKEFFEKLGAKKRNKKTREGHFREF